MSDDGMASGLIYEGCAMGERTLPGTTNGLIGFLPPTLGDLGDTQRAIPRIAKDKRLTGLIEQSLPQIPSSHDLYPGDAREMPAIGDESVHLVLTSPPYVDVEIMRRC